METILLDEHLDQEIDEEYYWEPIKRIPIEKTLEYNKDLSQEQNNELRNILKNNQDLFAYSIEDLKEPCNVIKHEIRLSDQIPVYIPPYRRSPRDNEFIKEEVKKLLKYNIIKESNSPYSAQPIVIRKEGKEPRFCVNYQEVNAKTLRDPYPMPRIDDIFDSLSGCKIISTLDAKRGYNQIEIEEQSKQYTGFTTSEGHYCCNRVPFGGKGGPATFNRAMRMIFKALTFVLIFLDDIIIKSNNIEEHFDHLRQVFACVRKANLKLNPSKCMFFRKELNLLGHTISMGAIKMNKEKIQAILDMKVPFKIKHVQSFLGLSGYYRRFIKDFSKIAAPLYKLLRKEIKFKWTPECQKAFEELKECLIKYPILRMPDFSKEFFLYTDASGVGLGGILCQKDNDNLEYVIQYGSRLLKGAELHYTITELECLAIIYFVKLWRIYLIDKKFTIVTDHASLQWLFNIKEKSGRLMRWAIYMSIYNYTIVYKSGKKHSNVDALSRPVLENEICVLQESETTSKTLDPYEDKFLLNYLINGKLDAGLSKKQIKRIKEASEKYFFKDESIWLKTNDLIKERKVPKIEEREKEAKIAHIFGHFDLEATYQRLKQNFYWKNMRQTCEKICKNCEACLKNNKAVSFNHPAIAIIIKGIFDTISMDYSFGFAKTEEGYIGILVIIEYLSKYPWIVPVKSKSAQETARHLFKYISIFGAPKVIISDEGKEFVNEVIQNLCQLTNIDKRITSPYNPQADGMAEKHMHTFANVIRKCMNEMNLEKELWVQMIPFAEMAYRSKIHSTTKKTPFFLVFGKKMNLLNDWTNETNEDEESAITKRTVELKKLLEYEHGITKKQIEKMQEIQKNTQDNRNHVSDKPLTIGTTVALKDCRLVKAKQDDRYIGPLTIYGRTPKGNYWLMNKDNVLLDKSYPRQKLKVGKGFENKNATRYLEDENETEVESEEEKTNTEAETVQPSTSKESEKTQVESSSENEPAKEKCAARNCLKPQTKVINWIQCDKCNDWYHMKCANVKEKDKKEIFLCEKCKKKALKVNSNKASNFLIAMVCLITLNVISGTELEGNYKFCHANSNAPIVDTEHKCSNEKNTFQTKTNELFTILEKRKYTVSGFGYNCKRTKRVVTTWRTFLGTPMSTSRLEILDTTKEECRGMLISKNCGEEIMKCEKHSDHCAYKEEPKVKYPYLDTQKFTKINCETKKVLIYTENLNSVLFDDAKVDCYPRDLFCIHKDSITIWDSDIIHKCPYFMIKQERFNQTENLMISNFNLFQITKQTEECEMIIISTTEGVFLTNDKKAEKLMKSEVDFQNNFHLTLSDVDLKTYKLLVFTNRIGNFNNKFKCNILKTILNSFKRNFNEFLTIENTKNDELIFYNANGDIKLTKCIEIRKIIFKNTMNECFNDLQIIMINNKKESPAFLSDQGIIRKYSRIIPCNQKRIIYTPNNTHQIQIEGKNIKIVNFTRNKIPINFDDMIHDKIEYTHDITTIENFDLLKEVDRLAEFRDGEHTYYAEKNEEDTIEAQKEGKTFYSYLAYFGNNIWSIIHTIFLYFNIILSIIIIIIIITVIIKCSNVIKKFRNKNKPKSQQKEDPESIEMSNLMPGTSESKQQQQQKQQKQKIKNRTFKALFKKKNKKNNNVIVEYAKRSEEAKIKEEESLNEIVDKLEEVKSKDLKQQISSIISEVYSKNNEK
jgi:hypothetical protein